MLTDLGERLALVIDAKTDNAVSNIRKLSAEEKAAADRAEVLKAKLADLEARAAKSPGSKTTQLQLSKTRAELAGIEANLAAVPQGAGLAERGLAKLGVQGGITGSALAKGLGGAAVAAAAFGAFEFFKDGVENYTHLADQIRAVQFAAQGTVEDASKLVAITNVLGVDSDTAALGVFRLGKNIALTPEKLTAVGIAVAKTKQGNVDLIATLGNVADAYQKTQDPAAKAAIVYEAFGRAGTSMLPILNANAEQLREIAAEAGKQGRIFNAKDLAEARNFEIEMRELKDSWESLGITAGKTLVPALASVAHGITDVLNAANSHTGQSIIKALSPLYAVASWFHGGGSGESARTKAEQEVARQAADATAKAFEASAMATLGDANSILAIPGEGLAAAKQTLSDAKQTLADAIATRRKAEQELATLRTKGPTDTSSALAAAHARTVAAEDRLRAAQYVGGDARVSSAKAAALSAQQAENKLRQQGGTYTNQLATATERLHKANESVATAQRKERQARQARDRATGLSAADITGQLTAQLKDKTALTAAQGKLADLGASRELIAYLDKQNQDVPGTLVKTVKGLTRNLVAQMNSTLDQVTVESQVYSSIAGSPDDWRAAGVARANAFSDGWQSVWQSGLPGKKVATGPKAGHPGTFSQLLTAGVTVQGDLNVKADDPATMARKVAAQARQRALGSGRNVPQQ